MVSGWLIEIEAEMAGQQFVFEGRYKKYSEMIEITPNNQKVRAKR